MEVIRAQRATRSEFIVETTMISRGIVNLAFSARTEFSVATAHGVTPQSCSKVSSTDIDCVGRCHSSSFKSSPWMRGAPPGDPGADLSHGCRESNLALRQQLVAL